MMKRLIRLTAKYAFLLMDSRTRKRIVMTLSCIVVFITTYMMILPAISLEKNEAAEDNGIVLQSSVREAEEPADAEEQEEAPPPSEDRVITGEEFLTGVQTAAGGDYAVTVDVPASALIPADAVLTVEEITGEEYDFYYAQTLEALGAKSVLFARFFDISLVENGEKIQPAEGSSIDVRIELTDKDDSEEAAASTQVVHFADDAETGDIVDVEVDGTAVSFAAESFSAYAIVEGPEPVSAPVDTLVTSLDELQSGTPYYLSYGSGQVSYCTNAVNSKNAFIEGTVADASEWYFEKYEDPDNPGGYDYYIYTYRDGVKKYIHQKGSGNEIELSDQKTLFELSETDAANKYYFKIKGADRWFQHSGSGSGMRFYTANTDVTNSRIIITKAAALQDRYDLDGKTFGLMSWNDNASGKAMMAASETSGENELDAKALTVMMNSDEDKLYASNDEKDLTMWTFESVIDDIYYLRAEVDGTTKYLKITNGGLSLSETKDPDCRITVVPGSGKNKGKICLKSGNTTLTYLPADAGHSSAFGIGGSAGSEWLYLVERSELPGDYFMTHTATKASVSDPSISNGSRVIVYTRIWNDADQKYEYYAIDHDGSLVRVYESGNTIQWVGPQLNSMLWNFVEYYEEGTANPNYYYDFYNQFSGKFIAPQIGQSDVLSDDPIGVNMPGRKEGRYYSKIVTWDDDHYSYAGLGIDTETDPEKYSNISTKLNEADDFYFAIVEKVPVDDVLHTVETVNNNSYGITMKMKDFATRDEMSDYLGNNDGGMGQTLKQDLLSTNLSDNGYPQAKMGSLETLFSGAEVVNHLFIESTHKETGYFEYDSCQNFASLGAGDGSERLFTVYRELGTYDSTPEYNTRKHGQFFPYNDIRPGVFASVNGKNLYDVLAEPLPDTDPRKNELLYNLQYDSNHKVNTYFGMELEASFTQTPDGLDDWEHPIIFEFTGDDDFWLYVNDELVLDLGGIHSAVEGSVNFATGEVIENGITKTLRSVFENNFRNRNKNATDAQVNAFLDKYFEAGGTVFKPYSTNTMRIFYMERGAGASNLHMRFNLASVRPGTVELSKTLSLPDNAGNAEGFGEYAYQIWYKDENDDEQCMRYDNDVLTAKVKYKGTDTPVKYQSSLTIGGQTYANVFLLKPGETAVIELPDKDTQYRIVECGLRDEVYEKVKVNGTEITGTAAGTNYKNYDIGYMAARARAAAKFDNIVKPEAFRELSIEKVLYDENGERRITYEENQTLFNFRLYLGTEYETGSLQLANMQPYHVKDNNGNYCRWDATLPTPGFVSLEKTNYSDLTDEERESATFHTSIYGAISKIPVDYTVVVSNLLVGTQYIVEERNNEVPDGYSLRQYVLYPDKPETQGEGGTAFTSPERKSIESGHDPYVEVHNLKGFGLRVNKVWPDADYMASRVPTYFAVYRNDGAQEHIVEGTLRQLPYKTKPQTLYWYFEHLPVSGTTLSDYVIREVNVENAVVDDDGYVTNYSSMTPIGQDGVISLYGTLKGDSVGESIKYTVQYETGEPPQGSNVRVDTVTNDRPGLEMIKTGPDGNPLPGARFSFTLEDDSGTTLGPFTSDENGKITIAYLRRNVNYILRETKSPQNYQGLAPMTICWNSDGTVYVDGSDSAGNSNYKLTQMSGENPHPTLLLVNRQYTFKAVKQDADTEAPLGGAVFALHKQVTSGDVSTINPDPIVGYENLTTNDMGELVREISGPALNALPPGTYELREKTAPGGYSTLSGHIRFTISDIGVISLTGNYNPEGVEMTEDSESSPIAYTLTIPNTRMPFKLKKVDALGSPLAGAKFKLTHYNNGSWEAVGTDAGVIDLSSLTEISLEGLTDGERYCLTETNSPAGYIILNSDVYFRTTGGRIVLTDADGNTAASPETLYPEIELEDEDTTIVVANNPGAELPATGGSGKTPFYLAGLMLIGAAGLCILSRFRRRA